MAFTVSEYWYDSCDIGAPASPRWNNLQSYASRSANNGRRGTDSYSGTNFVTMSHTMGGNYQDWAVNIAINPTGFGSVFTYFNLYDTATTQIDLRSDTSGHLYVTRNANVLGTSTQTLSSSVWVEVEVLAHIASGTDGWVDVNVSGVNWLHITGVSTQNTANAYANTFYVNGATQLDDIFLRCGSGLSTSDVLTDVGIQKLAPTGDGTGANWTQSTGGTHYGVVDEVPPSDTDYDSSSTVGAEQALTFADLASTSYTIVGPVTFNVWAKKDDVGTRMIKLFCTSNGSTTYSPAMPVFDTSQHVSYQFAQNPDGPQAWTATAVNAATFGYRLDS